MLLPGTPFSPPKWAKGFSDWFSSPQSEVLDRLGTLGMEKAHYKCKAASSGCLLPGHPFLPQWALSNQFTQPTLPLFSQSHNKQPWDPQGNKGYEPKLFNSIFMAANEPSQPSATWEKEETGQNSRFCKNMQVHQPKDFCVCFPALTRHKTLRWWLDLCHSPPITLQPRKDRFWRSCTPLQSSPPKDLPPLPAAIPHVPFPSCSAF